MNEQRTGEVKMSLKKATLWAAAILVIWGGSALGQQSLGDLAKGEGFGWIAGRWTATIDDGQTIDLIYKWELDGHLASMDFKMGEYAYKAMIFYDATESKVVEVGVDSKGGQSKGSWDVEGENLVSTTNKRDNEGKTQKIAIVHTKGRGRTMKVEVYSVDEYGSRAAEPWTTVEFKRKAPKAGTRAGRSNAKAQNKTN